MLPWSVLLSIVWYQPLCLHARGSYHARIIILISHEWSWSFSMVEVMKQLHKVLITLNMHGNVASDSTQLGNAPPSHRMTCTMMHWRRLVLLPKVLSFHNNRGGFLFDSHARCCHPLHEWPETKQKETVFVICIHCIIEDVGKQRMQHLIGGFLVGHQHLNNNDIVWQ